MTRRRIVKELQDAISYPTPGISLGPFGTDIFHWEGTITGNEGTSWEGGLFLLSINFPEQYPSHPPRITFKTKVYHPNINNNGVISLDVLSDCWSPALTAQKVLLCIQLLLHDPNPHDPLVPDVAHVCITNSDLYEATVREWTQKYAM